MQQRWLGEAQVSTPVTLSVMTVIFVVLAALLVAFLCLATYTRRIRVEGELRLNRGVTQVSLPASGEIADIAVREGQHVRAGDRLFTVVNPRPLPSLQDASAVSLRAIGERRQAITGDLAAQRNAAAQQLQALRAQLDDTNGQVRSIDADLKAQDARIAVANEIYQRYKNLQKDGLVSDLTLYSRLDQLTAQRQAREALTRTRLGLVASASQLRSQMSVVSSTLASHDAAASSALAQLEQEHATVEVAASTIVRAPVSGTVTGILAVAGARSLEGRELASIVPDSARLEAILSGTGEVAGVAKVGQPVLMRVDAFPYQQYGLVRGVVTAITPATVSPDPSSGVRAAPQFRLTVRLASSYVAADGVRYALKPGMTLSADVLLDKRHLIDWLLGPTSTLLHNLGR